MKNRATLPLLSEVLDEAAPPEFQARLFEKTMRAARQRKRHRQWSGTLLALGCLACGTYFLLPKPSLTPTLYAGQKPFTLVHSQALPANSVVHTSAESISTVRSARTVNEVASGKSENLFKVVGDEEMLAFLAGRPAALVYHGPGRAELILLDYSDLESERP